MLRLENIRKSYKTGDFTQVALNDVSLTFRDNEFVSILGPSGSGKTTLLNIIGGLDHYDSGNLIIDGISTKQYKDRDWDAYRNNRIGFVFQSYNLIPHQTILANVELALTLSGVSRDERRKRAVAELTRVGLGDHLHKKPSQLSGGQMQRVAIARALVNDPEILLADEPTGALDSATSIQIMDLLTEIANDRLVIMVTHNPELADQYSTRIVNLADGVIIDDSDPFVPTAADAAKQAKPPRRTSMSFLTALSLSFNNLMTKKGRTIMTAFAGSIGIIGIAAILALANGVNAYIKSVEEDTLSLYPLQIMSTGFDMTSMMMGSMGLGDDSDGGEAPLPDSGSAGESGDSAGNASSDSEGMVREMPIMTRMFSSIGANDLAALKEYFESGECDIDQYVQTIDYTYDVTPYIYLVTDAQALETTAAGADDAADDAKTSAGEADTSVAPASGGASGGAGSETADKPKKDVGFRQINPDVSFASLGIGSGMSTNSLMSMSMSTDQFGQLLGDASIVEEQYDVVAGHWPEKYNEVVLVLSGTGRSSDYLLYLLGLKDYSELEAMIRQFANEEEVVVPESEVSVTYQQIMDTKLKVVNPANFYRYDDEYDVWVNKSDNDAFMAQLVEGGDELVIAGIVRPNPDAKVTALGSGLYYTPELITHLVEYAADTPIVKEQLADPKVDVFSGKPFDADEDADDGFAMDSLFTIDNEALEKAFTFDTSKLSMDMGSLANMDLSSALPDMGSMDFGNFDLSGMDLSSMDFSGMDLSNMDLSSVDLSKIDMSDLDLSGIQVNPDDLSGAVTVNPTAVTEMSAALADGFFQKMTDPDFLQGFNQAYPEASTLPANERTQLMMQYYMTTPEAQAIAAEYMPQVIDTSKLGETISQVLVPQITQAVATQLAPKLAEAISTQLVPVLTQAIATEVSQQMSKMVSQQLIPQIQRQVQATMTTYMTQVADVLATQTQAAVEDAMSGMMENMGDAFSVDEDAFANAFQFNMDQEELTELFMSMMRVEENSYDNNLRKLGYANFAKPSAIDIYPKDFESKEEVITILDNYNERMAAEGQEDKEITYTDLVGTLMSSVTTIVNMISYVLIAFVAISLVVSSIMIGVITYISVLERKKEIGILRSIGASKGDVSRVFNAETIIEGLVAGLLGVGITALACIPANAIVYAVNGVPNVAQLPWQAGLILVLISVFLTTIAGLMPASSASRKDPVEALRSE